jgi:hypothetical protein
MNSDSPRTLPGRIAGSVIRRLLRYVTWHASESHNLSGEPGAHLPLVVILGREHYAERQKSYPALRTRDLQKVLQEELAGQPPTLTLPGPVRGDRREVRFFRLDSDVVDALPRSVFVIPESVVLAAQLSEDDWADVERQGFRYFLFRDGVSQPAGGALGQRELVAMAAGVDPGRNPVEYRGSNDLILRLRQSLSSLSTSTWWSCRNPIPRDWGLDRVAWKPIALTASLMLFAYLALSSIYLQSLLSHRSGVLLELEPEIQEGLVTDNEARAYEVQRDALIELWSGRRDTQQAWESVAIALRNNATISQIDMRDGRVSLRGDAPDASEVLAVLASTPRFDDVSFEAPIRSGRNGRQTFALSFVLSDERVAAEVINE